MAFFNKNPNETAYAGGKKHWADVIKNTGPGGLLIWRQPEEDFNTNSTLIVMPGEEAIFIKSGNIEQVFEKGTYKLSTSNYPFISRLRNAFTGGISTFNCVVYFVRSADSKEMRWGTATPIQVRDKVWGIRTEAKVRGAYKVRIENPAKFLEKLVGSNINYQTQEDLDKYFVNEFQGKIKSAVSAYLNALNQELIGIDAYMDEIAQNLLPQINNIVSDYGLKCASFSISGMDIDVTKYDTLDESQMDLIRETRGYQGKKAGLDILGNDWRQVQDVEILKNISNNPASGGFAAVGAGIGMGFGAMGTFGNITQQTLQNGTQPVTPQQPIVPQQPVAPQQPIAPIPTPPPTNTVETAKSPKEILSELKQLLDEGLIEQSEYDAKKSEILGRM